MLFQLYRRCLTSPDRAQCMAVTGGTIGARYRHEFAACRAAGGGLMWQQQAESRPPLMSQVVIWLPYDAVDRQ